MPLKWCHVGVTASKPHHSLFINHWCKDVNILVMFLMILMFFVFHCWKGTAFHKMNWHMLTASSTTTKLYTAAVKNGCYSKNAGLAFVKPWQFQFTSSLFLSIKSIPASAKVWWLHPLGFDVITGQQISGEERRDRRKSIAKSYCIIPIACTWQK